MNDITAAEAYRLSFCFDIPYHLCENEYYDELDTSCTPSIAYERALAGKYLVILSNQKRFDSNNYDGKGHIVKESAI